MHIVIVSASVKIIRCDCILMSQGDVLQVQVHAVSNGASMDGVA